MIYHGRAQATTFTTELVQSLQVTYGFYVVYPIYIIHGSSLTLSISPTMVSPGHITPTMTAQDHLYMPCLVPSIPIKPQEAISQRTLVQVVSTLVHSITMTLRRVFPFLEKVVLKIVLIISIYIQL